MFVELAGEVVACGFVAVEQQVAAQFGDSSDELASTGLKKKSEYKRRSAKKTPPAP